MTAMTLGPLAQIARTVRDIKESEAWYGGALGLPHLYSFGSLAFFDCGGTRLMLSAQESPSRNPFANCASGTSVRRTTCCARAASSLWTCPT